MPKLGLFNIEAKQVGEIQLNDNIFAAEVNADAMHQVVVALLANKRQGTQSAKTRAEVRGGGIKPWRQKGTGRARAGSTRSPIWVGGGTVFGPTGIQNFKIKQNKKQHKLALKSAFSLKAKEDLVVLDSLKVSGKTKEMVAVLKALKLENAKTLIITSDPLVYQAAGNLSNVGFRTVGNISVYDLLNFAKVLVVADDVKKIEEVLK